MDTRAIADQVNDQVNRDLTWQDDLVTFGRPEFWEQVRGRGLGDCEDFTLTKRHKLLELGVPHDRIWFQVCYTETGEGHAVLRVRIDDGTDVVLDNRQPGLETPAGLVRVGYQFIEHIRSDGVGGWHASSVTY